MPRYIDADKLTRMFIGNLTFVPQEFIDSAETVDAIPVEWLKKYRQKKKRKYGGVDVYSSIKNIISDWRKENESNADN